MKGYKGDEIDYLAFNPALQTSKIKINLVSDSSVKCLRMEFYGCSKKEFSYNDYTGKNSFWSSFLQNIFFEVTVPEVLLIWRQ